MESFIDSINGHFKELLTATNEQMHKLQPGPPGTRERSRREKRAILDKLATLPRPELQTMMEAIAERAGHTPVEERPCELCRFLADFVPTGGS